MHGLRTEGVKVVYAQKQCRIIKTLMHVYIMCETSAYLDGNMYLIEGIIIL